jgi:hypothetical protein
MLSQSHDKKVDAMHKQFEQAGVIDLHFATLWYTGNIGGWSLG